MVIGNVFQDILSWFVSVNETHAQYWNDNYLFVILYVMCFVIVICQRDKNLRGHNLMSLYSLMLIGLVLYNPIAHYIEYCFFKNSEAIRMWLLLPVGLMIAYAITIMTGDSRLNKACKGTVNFGIAVLIVFFGSTIMRADMMIETPNSLKINNESVQIANIILDSNDNEPTTLLVFSLEDYTYGQFVNGGTISNGIEQYTADIQVTHLNLTVQRWEDNYVSDISPDGVYAVSYVPVAMETYHHTIDFEYIALPASDSVISKMNVAGFELVGQTESYYVYKANSEWEIIRLDYTGDDGTDLYVVRDRLGHYILIDPGSTQDVEQIKAYVRSTTIEIDAWIMSDADNSYVVEELLNAGWVQIDRIYSYEETNVATDIVKSGDTLDLYGLTVSVNDGGNYTLHGTVDEYSIVPADGSEDVVSLILE